MKEYLVKCNIVININKKKNRVKHGTQATSNLWQLVYLSRVDRLTKRGAVACN